MGTSKEYLLFSILSYYNLKDESLGLNIINALEDIDLTKSFSSNSELFKDDFNKRGKEYFFKELSEWKIYSIDNRTGINGNGKSNSGFFAIIFKKNDEYVISYRGSETYPFEEAYKDFIETDLRIGLGKKPLQFWEGLEVFEDLMQQGVPFDKISVTGHSLGGGIAQFVAVMIYKKYGIVPKVCTWNSVGIQRDGIIGIEDFIDYNKILETCNLSEDEKQVFMDFKDSYFNFLLKELKKNKVIKDNKTVLIDRYSTFYFDIDNAFLENFAKETSFKDVLKKFSTNRQRELLIKEQLIDKLFQIENLVDIMYEAVDFIDIVNENKIFQRKVVNFCHSKDLVSFLFPHVGRTYQVDRDFLEKDTGKQRTFFRNLFIFKKSLQNYHFEDVFIPFLTENGYFTKEISMDYASSVFRKILYLERTFSREFLGKYFLRITLNKDNFSEIKREIILGIEKSGEDILYKDKVLRKIKIMDFEKIDILWKKTIEKVASPYISQDIYDLIVF